MPVKKNRKIFQEFHANGRSVGLLQISQLDFEGNRRSITVHVGTFRCLIPDNFAKL